MVLLVEEKTSFAVHQLVKSASTDQRLHGLSAGGSSIHPAEEFKEVRVRAIFFAFRNNGRTSRFANALHGCQAKAYGSFFIHGKSFKALVHIRPEYLKAHSAAFFYEEGHLCQIAFVVGKQGGHEFGRIVGLQVGRLPGHDRIAGRVGFVERVFRKGLPIAPDLLQNIRRMTVLARPLHEERLEFIELGLDLLSHGLPQLVCLSTRESSQFSAQHHHLFLVNRNAVGLGEDLFHDGQVVLDLLFAVLSAGELRNVFHGTGPVQSVHRDHILKSFGPKQAKILLHSRRFELEKTRGFPFGK